jgi:hypothetical protein
VTLKTNTRTRFAHAFVSVALLTSAFVALPGPGAPKKASAALSGPALAYFARQGAIVQLQGFPYVFATATAQQAPLSAFNVQVDGVRVDVVSLDYSLPLFLLLTLASPVYQTSTTASVTYTAPALDNTLNNAALQDAQGRDTGSFSFTLDLATAGQLLSATPVPTVVAGPESATITVAQPTSGATPRSYEVTATPGGKTCTVTGASGACTISGLTAGTAYTFSVVAKRSGYADSAASPASDSVTVLSATSVSNDSGIPNAPGVATVVAGAESATVTVAPPSSGAAPTSYTVTASPGGKTCTVTGASGSCTISGLIAGTAYTFSTVANTSSGSSPASSASASVTALVATKTATWDSEPATDSEFDTNTEGFFPNPLPGLSIITDEFGFVIDKKGGIKPKIRMKNYSGKIKMTISAIYKDAGKAKKFSCTFKPFGTTQKIKSVKWRWYTPKKACVLPKALVAAVQKGETTISAKGKWTRQWLTSAKKARPDKTKIKARTLKYTMRAKPSVAS